MRGGLCIAKPPLLGGWALCTPTHHQQYQHTPLCTQPPILPSQWVPTLTLGRSRSTNTRKQYKLHVERAPDGTKPLSIFGEIPIQAASGVQVLHIEEWRRTWPLREVVATATPAADVNNSPPLFYTVVVCGWVGEGEGGWWVVHGRLFVV